ncbi:hypothetical protein GmHk_09G025368 [Glycine max]|nr:hypothetical protein GmHk_09G025368 [Glycine max]
MADLKSCHHMDSLVADVPSSRALHPPYFEFRILTQRSSCCCIKFHLHFPSKALLKVLISFIPRPLLSFGRQIVSHLTHAIFFSSRPPPHRNLLWIWVSFSTTLLGILKKER